jgi:hypothetical protein
MRQTLAEYKASISLTKELSEAGTMYFGELNTDEQRVLSDYFFARRDLVADKDLAGYRDLLAMGDTDVEARALHALGRLKQTAHVPQ